MEESHCVKGADEVEWMDELTTMMEEGIEVKDGNGEMQER